MLLVFLIHQKISRKSQKMVENIIGDGISSFFIISVENLAIFCLIVKEVQLVMMNLLAKGYSEKAS